MIRRLVLAAALLAAGFSWSGAATAGANPCSVSFTDTTGDGYQYGTVYAGNIPAGLPGSLDDLDITGGRITLTPTDLVATITVKKLAGSSPAQLAAAGLFGDAFSFSAASAQGRNVSAGYHRTVSGGAPNLFYDGGNGGAPATADGLQSPFPTGLEPSYDVAASTVTLSLPRADVQRALHQTSGIVLRGLDVGSQGRVPGAPTRSDSAGPDPSATLSFDACDRTLRKTSKPCQLQSSRETGDEESLSGPDAPQRDDNLDVTSATLTVTGKDVTVVAKIARLANQSVDSTGGDYSFYLGDVKGKGHYVDAFHDTAKGDWLVGLDGTTQSAAGVFDLNASTVTVRLSRADLAKAMGTTSAKLVIAGFGVEPYWQVDGTAIDQADSVGTSSALKAAGCR